MMMRIKVVTRSLHSKKNKTAQQFGNAQSIYFLFFTAVPAFLSGYNLNLLNLKELVTTDTELNAMAPAAIMGLRKPSAATGNARTL